MTDYKARVVLAPEVHKIITHLTNNLDTEIGAVGKVSIRQENGEKYFYVYKLLFPQQNVTGATVHFTPAMWGSLVKKYGLAELKDIAWYWHRHPGNSAHSETDEENTFNAFMDKDANRNFFIFYQTAIGTDDTWNDEARIDIRKPIRATILDKDIDVTFEDPDEKKIERICDQIIKDAIIETPNVEVIDWSRGSLAGRNYTTQKSVKTVDDYSTAWEVDEKDRVSIKFEHGQATILTGLSFKELLVNALKKTGKLNGIVGKWQITKEDKYQKIKLQPKKKSYNLLKETLIGMFSVYEAILDERLEEEEGEDYGDTINIIDSPDVVSKLFKSIDDGGKIEWNEDNTEGTVYDTKLEVVIGQIWRDKENK